MGCSLAPFHDSAQDVSQLMTRIGQTTHVKKGPVELSKSAAVRLNGARPSHRTGVADAKAALTTAVSKADNIIASPMQADAGQDEGYDCVIDDIRFTDYNQTEEEKPRTFFGVFRRCAGRCGPFSFAAIELH